MIKDAFIDKGILSLFGMLSKIRAQDSPAIPRGPASLNINPFYKVAFTLALIILIALSRNLLFVFSALSYLLLIIAFLPSIDLKRTLFASLAMFFISCLLLAPAALSGNLYSLFMIPSKMFATVAAANILSCTTKWQSIIGALKLFFIPDVFIFILDTAMKYIVMLGELSLEMLYAMKLRRFGGGGGLASLSGVAGTVFLKSAEMAEEMNSAMLCRGFRGVYHSRAKLTMTAADAAYIIANASIFALFFYLR
ncbi:MAG: energy-coupling factor transporter transmembrane protein EcfT [Clostridiales bacterium]|nr:energy-coupling factor transporter transmembrane protein EcfT [Clostridiales bacterium]